jgi:hypothetical protein
MHTPNTLPAPRVMCRRIRNHRVLLPAIACLAMVAAGCGGTTGSRVAQLGASTAPTNTGAAVTGSPSPQAYASCMRSHGVPTFPDPNSKGQVHTDIASLDSPKFRSAQRVCRSLLPSGQVLNTQRGSLTPGQQAQFLKYARCMRTHGIPNFPDPTSSGLSLSEVDPNSPRFQAAQTACRTLLPNRGKGNFQSGGGGRAKP